VHKSGIRRGASSIVTDAQLGEPTFEMELFMRLPESGSRKNAMLDITRNQLLSEVGTTLVDRNAILRRDPFVTLTYLFSTTLVSRAGLEPERPIDKSQVLDSTNRQNARVDT
jgi:hypothetical protein